MTNVVFTGWHCGLDKVGLDKALHNTARLPLSKAIDATEQLLAGESVVVRVPNEHIARQLVAQATSLGAVCSIEVDGGTGGRE